LHVELDSGVRNRFLCRAVNDKIYELSGRLVYVDAVEYLCECGDLECPQRVLMPHDEYRRVRRRPAEFIVAPGHERPDLEEVVSRDARWVVVRKPDIRARSKTTLVSAH
jgi:hypothetical protein